jgi:myosin tail region-interacting protein MTI1
MFEMEDNSSSRRGGHTTVLKSVYVLFPDYSQTIVTAHFDAKAPQDVTLDQRHEPPPPRLRQDQLEQYYSMYGAQIASHLKSMENTIIGDGTPHAVVLETLSKLKDVLMPIGTRAFGAPVYANLANATVQQFDEIRPGDIVTFRNAKFQGKHGAMHAKYSMEAGKPDHVGIVADWDGTKKKIRALEQGRESRKCKVESFRLGDLRSGEVRVWRVMPRAWVGWEGGSYV